ncbi:MAG TPA: NlpC/P60 family protein, partial [Bacillota bacterium]|nr:NlpC/P60 family protein [Bacillota bacterium]
LYCYNAVGFKMTYHGATWQAQLYGTKVPFKGRDFSPLLPGDLIFFSKGSGYHHVGIYVGNNQMIHAQSRGGVRVVSLMNYYQIPALVKRIFD